MALYVGLGNNFKLEDLLPDSSYIPKEWQYVKVFTKTSIDTITIPKAIAIEMVLAVKGDRVRGRQFRFHNNTLEIITKDRLLTLDCSSKQLAVTSTKKKSFRAKGIKFKKYPYPVVTG